MMALPATHKEAHALLKPTQFHHRAVAIIFFPQTPTRNPLFELWAAQEARPLIRPRSKEASQLNLTDIELGERRA
jgi:hypothetical protein